MIIQIVKETPTFVFGGPKENASIVTMKKKKKKNGVW